MNKYNTNVFGVFQLLDAIIPSMKKNKKGRILLASIPSEDYLVFHSVLLFMAQQSLLWKVIHGALLRNWHNSTFSK